MESIETNEMGLSKIILSVNKKKGEIVISRNGLRINSLGENFTIHELQYMAAISFIYLGQEIYGKDYPTKELMERSKNMYEKYHKTMKYKKFNGKNIKNMLK